MRVATRYSHSIPRLVCPDGDDGLIVSTENLNNVINIDQEKMLITLESGVTLRQLINEAAKSGLALPYSPYWWGLTIGGLLGTGAHGSTLWGEGSAIHDYVVRMRIVTPSGPGETYAEVRTLEDNGDFAEDMKAAKVSLGVLGVISQVTLKGDVTGKCNNGKLTTTLLIKGAYGLTNDGILFKGYPVIGNQNRLQASGGCLKGPNNAEITACPWDPRVKGLFFHQTTFSIVLSKAKDFIQDVQNLVSLVPQSLCGIDMYNGILMRYVTGSNAYLGKQEDSLDFDITYYRSKDPKKPRLYEDVLEEIEQMAVFKYGGFPHWGKNRNIAFVGAIKKYNKAREFLKVKEKYDPLGLFSSEWTNQVLGLKDGLAMVKEGCALEGLCMCSEDIHCAPQKGYLCRPGKVFKEARVCSLVQPGK
uniref:L-gulonolactone oxidase n=1 Tax=Tanacetum cinerariifolium TaxID=118510 RepID=A0A6L2NRW0_TANCI|nr:probable L-gulonolactone oxidase 6 [Tanacetum cinerariifolium]